VSFISNWPESDSAWERERGGEGRVAREEKRRRTGEKRKVSLEKKSKGSMSRTTDLL
jgi:hypothetical protein